MFNPRRCSNSFINTLDTKSTKDPGHKGLVARVLRSFPNEEAGRIHRRLTLCLRMTFQASVLETSAAVRIRRGCATKGAGRGSLKVSTDASAAF